MDPLKTLIDHLASPPWLFGFALGLFFLSRDARRPWTRAGGVVLSILIAGLLGLCASDPTCRRLLLHPDRLPVVLLLLATLAVVWFEMHRSQAFDGTEPTPQREALFGFSTADILAATAIGVILIGCALLYKAPFYEPPLSALADPTSKPIPIKAPWFLVGLQELRLDFEPWMAYRVLPIFFVFGLVCLPWFHLPEDPEGRQTRGLFLCGWLILWLGPMVVGALLRSPHGGAFGPFEPWDATRPADLEPQPLSQLVWIRWLGVFEPSRWWLRELPGFLLLITTFFLLPRWLARWRFTEPVVQRTREAMGFWRFHVTSLCLLVLLIIPLKALGRWVAGLGHWLHLPEFGIVF